MVKDYDFGGMKRAFGRKIDVHIAIISSALVYSCGSGDSPTDIPTGNVIGGNKDNGKATVN